MKHKIHLVFLFVGLGIFSVFAQQEADRQTPQKVTEEEAVRMGQDLINLLESNRYFEAKNLYDTICVKVDTIHPFIESFYRMNMCRFENKPDSAAYYLEEMIKKRFFTGIGSYFYLWGINAEELQDYKKAYQTLDRARAYLEQNPDTISMEDIKEIQDYLIDLERQTTRRAAEPTIRVVRKNTENSTPLLPDTVLKAGYLLFNASYNGHKPIRTLFDTGVTEYAFIDSEIAKQMGIRKYPVYEKDTAATINGIRISGYLGILDSMQIANITLFHIPVIVLDMKSIFHIPDSFAIDSLKRAETISGFYEHAKVMMGLKTMNLIGQIILDQENNQLYFPMETEESKKKKEKNIFWCYNRLFTQLKINNLPVTTFIDSGSNDYIRMDTSFYEKYKAYLLIDTLKEKKNYYQMMMTGTQAIPFEIIVKEPVVMFTNKVIHPEKDDYVYISFFAQWGKTYPDMVESTVGSPFLKRLGKKILFDFRNMRMEVVE